MNRFSSMRSLRPWSDRKARKAAERRTPIVQNQDDVLQVERFDESLEVAGLVLHAVCDIGLFRGSYPDEVRGDAARVGSLCSAASSPMFPARHP
jgi:hypothetical protein